MLDMAVNKKAAHSPRPLTPHDAVYATEDLGTDHFFISQTHNLRRIVASAARFDVTSKRASPENTRFILESALDHVDDQVEDIRHLPAEKKQKHSAIGRLQHAFLTQQVVAPAEAILARAGRLEEFYNDRAAYFWREATEQLREDANGALNLAETMLRQLQQLTGDGGDARAESYDDRAKRQLLTVQSQVALPWSLARHPRAAIEFISRAESLISSDLALEELASLTSSSPKFQ